MEKLQWLPLKYRVLFKIDLVTYKIQKHGQLWSVYLSEFIYAYTYTRRSSPELKFLHTPNFAVEFTNQINIFPILSVIKHLWNSLPFQVTNSPSVTSFRKHLNTHLFYSSFPT